MPRIPEDITEHEIMELNSVLRIFLRELGDDGQPLYASCRLKKTGKADVPVFIAWVETMRGVRTRRRNGHPHPPSRFGDEHVSQVFKDCLAGAGKVISKSWAPGPDRADHDSLEYGIKWYRETHRRSIAIKVGYQNVGTLNVGFEEQPHNTVAVDNTFEKWAQLVGPVSELVNSVDKILW